MQSIEEKTIAFQKAGEIYDNDDETQTWSINRVSPIIMVLPCQATPEKKRSNVK